MVLEGGCRGDNDGGEGDSVRSGTMVKKKLNEEKKWKK